MPLSRIDAICRVFRSFTSLRYSVMVSMIEAMAAWCVFVTQTSATRLVAATSAFNAS